MGKLLIFDLDGTLIDSAGGIAHSVNRTRKYFNFPELDEKLISSYVGNGAKKLLERAVSDVTLPVSLDEAVKIMIDFYADDPLYHTFCYDGVADGLRQLKSAGWILTTVSNKPQIVAEKILDGLNLTELLSANIGGGGQFPLKPAPDAIDYLLKKFNCSPNTAWVIGDNYTDLAAAANAGVPAIFCRYGIGNKLDYPADKEVASFTELTDYIINSHLQEGFL